MKRTGPASQSESGPSMDTIIRTTRAIVPDFVGRDVFWRIGRRRGAVGSYRAFRLGQGDGEEVVEVVVHMVVLDQVVAGGQEGVAAVGGQVGVLGVGEVEVDA